MEPRPFHDWVEGRCWRTASCSFPSRLRRLRTCTCIHEAILGCPRTGTGIHKTVLAMSGRMEWSVREVRARAAVSGDGRPRSTVFRIDLETPGVRLVGVRGNRRIEPLLRADHSRRWVATPTPDDALEATEVTPDARPTAQLTGRIEESPGGVARLLELVCGRCWCLSYFHQVTAAASLTRS